MPYTEIPFSAILQLQTQVLKRQNLDAQPRRTTGHVRKSPHSRGPHCVPGEAGLVSGEENRNWERDERQGLWYSFIHPR